MLMKDATSIEPLHCRSTQKRYPRVHLPRKLKHCGVSYVREGPLFIELDGFEVLGLDFLDLFFANIKHNGNDIIFVPLHTYDPLYILKQKNITIVLTVDITNTIVE